MALQRAGTDVVMNLWSRRHLPEGQASRLGAWLNRVRPDVYIVSISPAAGWLALPLLDPGIATMAIVHSDGPAFYQPLTYYRGFVDCAVGVSSHIYQEIISTCNMTRECARRIPYGVISKSAVDLSARVDARDQAAALRIAYVGRLIQSQKRVLELIPLATELKRRAIPFELHLVGEGPQRSSLENGFRQNNLMRHVKFWGWLAPDVVRQRLMELDVLVLLSDVEGLPLALLESMGCGAVPVVTNIRSGHSEILKDGENGFLVGVGDISGFADRLELLARDRRRLSRMGREAWKASQEYSLEKMVASYVETFQQTVRGVSGRRQREGLTSRYPVMPSCRSKYPFVLRKVKSYLFGLGSGRVRGIETQSPRANGS
jgi:glycosyltransferase involved in cell wall biosynthesis